VFQYDILGRGSRCNVSLSIPNRRVKALANGEYRHTQRGDLDRHSSQRRREARLLLALLSLTQVRGYLDARAERPRDKDNVTGSHDVIKEKSFVIGSNCKWNRQLVCRKPGFWIVSPCHPFMDRCLGRQLLPEAFHMASI
jgi:hypothetical protein